MRGVKSFAQIAGGQKVLSDKLSIVARLAVAVILFALALVLGRQTLALVDAGLIVLYGAHSLWVGLLLAAKKPTDPLYVPGLVLDAAALLAVGLVALSVESIESALVSLYVIEGLFLCMNMLTAIRLTVRDCILAAAVSAIVPGVIAVRAVLSFPGTMAYTLLVVPFLNALVGSFTTPHLLQLLLGPEEQPGHRGPPARQQAPEDDDGHRHGFHLQSPPAHQQACGRVLDRFAGRARPSLPASSRCPRPRNSSRNPWRGSPAPRSARHRP